MQYDNPATRLKTILDIGLKENEGKPCIDAWCTILQIPPNEKTNLLNRLGKVMLLPSQTQVLIERHYPLLIETYPQWVEPIHLAFSSQTLNGPWLSFKQHINPNCISHIAMLSELLNAKLPIKILNDTDLNKISQNFTDLMQDIDNSNLSDRLKNYLYAELKELRESIRDYKITGQIPIMKQAESLVGHSIIDVEYKNFLTDNDLGRRLIDNLTAMANLITVSTGLIPLSTVISTLIK
jgi:hypothetical protein